MVITVVGLSSQCPDDVEFTVHTCIYVAQRTVPHHLHYCRRLFCFQSTDVFSVLVVSATLHYISLEFTSHSITVLYIYVYLDQH